MGVRPGPHRGTEAGLPRRVLGTDKAAARRVAGHGPRGVPQRRSRRWGGPDGRTAARWRPFLGLGHAFPRRFRNGGGGGLLLMGPPPQSRFGVGRRAVLKGPDFFFLLRTALKDRPKGPPTANSHQPPTATNRQPPTAANRRQPPAATNRQLPTTANRHQPPITNHQPPPTATNHQLPTANRQLPPTTNRQPPTATNHG